jgi:hypothetical protein
LILKKLIQATRSKPETRALDHGLDLKNMILITPFRALLVVGLGVRRGI